MQRGVGRANAKMEENWVCPSSLRRPGWQSVVNAQEDIKLGGVGCSLMRSLSFILDTLGGPIEEF